MALPSCHECFSLRIHLLAPPSAMAEGRDLATPFEILLAELQATHKIDWYRALVDSASLRAPCGGEKTGPIPRIGANWVAKHHLLTDAHGIPLAITLTGANRHDVTQLLPLVEKIPHVGGKVGAPGSGQSKYKETVPMIRTASPDAQKKRD